MPHRPPATGFIQIVVGISLVIYSGIHLLGENSATSSSGSLVVIDGSSDVDVGEARQGETTTHTFHLKNALPDGRIDISRTETDCGCITAGLNKSSLAAGEATSLTVRVQLSGRGSVRRHVRLHYATGNEKHSFPLTIRATVIPDYAVLPPQVSFNKTEVGNALVRFVPKMLPNVSFASATANHPSLSVGWISEPDESGERQLRIKYDPDLAANLRWATLKVYISTSSPAEPLYALNVKFSSNQ